MVGAGDNITTDRRIGQCRGKGRGQAYRLEIGMYRQGNPGTAKQYMEIMLLGIAFAHDNRQAFRLPDGGEHKRRIDRHPSFKGSKDKDTGLQHRFHCPEQKVEVGDRVHEKFKG